MLRILNNLFWKQVIYMNYIKHDYVNTKDIFFIGTFLIIFILMRRPKPSKPPIKWAQTELLRRPNLSKPLFGSQILLLFVLI